MPIPAYSSSIDWAILLPEVPMGRPLTIAEVQADLESLVEHAAHGEVIPISQKGKIIAEIRPAGTRGRLGRMAGSVQFLGDVIAPIDVPWGDDD